MKIIVLNAKLCGAKAGAAIDVSEDRGARWIAAGYAEAPGPKAEEKAPEPKGKGKK